MIAELRAQMTEARAAYQAKAQEKESVWRPLSNRVRELAARYNEALVAGARACGTCGQPAMGVERKIQVSATKVLDAYQIGCSGRCTHSTIDTDRDKAVAEWNERLAVKEV